MFLEKPQTHHPLYGNYLLRITSIFHPSFLPSFQSYSSYVLTALTVIGLVGWIVVRVASAKITPKPVDEETRLITIQEGDTLPKLAKEYLNDPLLWKEFTKYNNFTDPNLLLPGEKMQIPFTLQPQAIIVAEFTWAGEEYKISLADLHAAIEQLPADRREKYSTKAGKIEYLREFGEGKLKTLATNKDGRLIGIEGNGEMFYTEGELRQYYEEHKSRYVNPEEVRIVCISLRDKNRAEEVMKMIKDGKDIVEMAKELYEKGELEGPGARNGRNPGHISLRGRGTGVSIWQPFPDAVFEQEIGEMNDEVLEIAGTYYLIFRKANYIPRRQKTFDEVRDEIKREKNQESIERTVDDAKRKAKLRTYPERISGTTPKEDSLHQLVRGVRVIPASTTEPVDSPERLTAPIPRESKEWGAIIKSAGIQPESEECLNCHFKGKTPKKVHPGRFLTLHDPTVFGCVLCHGGDSGTTEKEKAHASTTRFPFLKRRQTEAACGMCHTAPAVPDAPLLSGGRFLLSRYGCVTCHELPIEIPTVPYAPRHDTLGNKVGRKWLEQWLEDPTVYLPRSRMPKIEMLEHERDAIVEFLLSLRNDKLFQPIMGKEDAENGRKIFVDNECQTCHSLHGVGDKIGPELERVGTKVSRLWLTTYLRNPAALHPNTKMPDYEFRDQDILDVTEYMLRHFSDDSPVLDQFSDYSPDPIKVREGFKFYINKGCAQCHGITRYMNVNVTEKLMAWDVETAIKRIQAHRGSQIDVPEINIPASDLALVKVALLAMRSDDMYKSLAYRLDRGQLGDINEFVEAFWQFPIPLQGEPPDYYNDTVSKLTSESCGSCHVKQWEEWKTTRHAMAMGPGVWGQLIGPPPEFVNVCSSCHTPLSEQYEYLQTPDGEHVENRAYDAQLQAQGITCAACHVRAHQRFGPPFSETTAAAQVFGEGHHGGVVVSRAYQDSAFCKSCHQFEEEGFSLNGKLMQDTYNEWLESPHAKQGQTCQSCHMPERSHRWRGIYDLHTVREALKLNVEMKDRSENIEAEIRLTNEGAGHHLPTYATPAIFVTVRVLDSTGKRIPGTEQVRAIQRHAPLKLNREELYDTRIPAGGTWVYTYQKSRPEHAEVLEIQVDVHPDFFYRNVFRNALKVHDRMYQPNNPDGRAVKQYIEEALEMTSQSPYVLLTKQIRLE